jgi:hypothetical protein
VNAPGSEPFHPQKFDHDALFGLFHQPPYRCEAPMGGTPLDEKPLGVVCTFSISCERKEKSISK